MSEVNEMVLPIEKVSATRVNPKRLLLYSAPKAGKTTVVSKLKNCLLIDLEDGSDFCDALKIKVNNLEELASVIKAVKEKGCPYDYIAIDTISKLEEMVKPLAARMYRETPIGKNWKEDDVTQLPQGAGYWYLRKAFFKVLNELDQCAEHVILIGHLKEKFIEKNGQEVQAKDLDLTGKIKAITCADCDAVGYLYRKDKKVLVNFVSSEEQLCGARPAHLRGQEIVLAESDDAGNITVDWTKIYI